MWWVVVGGGGQCVVEVDLSGAQSRVGDFRWFTSVNIDYRWGRGLQLSFGGVKSEIFNRFIGKNF